MAILDDDKDKLIGSGDPAASSGASGGGAAGSTGSSPALGNSGSAFAGGSGSPTGGAGTGGQAGQWTNIQSYLDANKGNTSSSKLVGDVANQIGDEKQNLDTQAQTAKDTADKEAAKTNIGQDQASKLITQASNSQKGSDPYNQAVDPLKTAATSQYAGPQDFTYGINSNVQNYGGQLQDDKAFGGLMNTLYSNAANQTGNTLTQGQLNLQKQLDLDPTAAAAINDQRQSALKNYAGLNTDYSTLVPSTNQAIQNDISQFGSQQKSLNDYLNQQQTSNLGTIDSAVGAHNAGVTTAANQDQLYNNQVQDALTKFNGFQQSDQNKANLGAPFAGGINANNFLQYANTQAPDGKTYLQAQYGVDPNSSQEAIDYTNAFRPLYEMLNGGVNYSAGSTADRSTIGGVDQNRNLYNVIQDVFGKDGAIADGPDAQDAAFKQNYNSYVPIQKGKPAMGVTNTAGLKL